MHANWKQISTLNFLEGKSRKYVVINTHRCLFHSKNNWIFGIMSPIEMFHRVLESLLQPIDGGVDLDAIIDLEFRGTLSDNFWRVASSGTSRVDG